MKDDSLEHYRNREHGYIKHRILETYLLKVFNILGKYEKQINYVDGFAGLWQSQDERRGDTSSGISIECMTKCIDSVQSTYRRSINFRGLYIEKSAKKYRELESFVDGKARETGIDLTAWQGPFEGHVDRIKDWCGDAFTFFFIDPMGWSQSLPSVVAPLLSRPKSEFLIYFPTDHIKRFSGLQSLQDQMTEILGSPADLAALSSDERENTIVNLYRRTISQVASAEAGERVWTAYEPIRDPARQRTKYHLVYLTKHHKGIVAFKETSENLGDLQDSVRAVHLARKLEEEKGQMSLLPPSLVPNDPSLSDQRAISEIRKYWLSELESGPKRFGVVEIAEILDQKAWRLTDTQKALLELVNGGRIVNEAAPNRRRSKKPLHYAANNGEGEVLRLS